MSGKVISINVKTKTSGESGLPKHPVEEVQANAMGCEGDYNHYRKTAHNNTPKRALLLYTEDKLEELRSEGWPIKIGDLGENITIAGMKYEEFKIGDKFSIGEIICEITEKCNPCKNLGELPYVGKKVNEFIKTTRNRRGWYAAVLQEGKIRKGDQIKKL